MTLEEFQTIVRKPVSQWCQFNHCQAWLGNTSGCYTLVKSYSTIVGAIDWTAMRLYYAEKYSRTTSKQLTQIARAHGLEVEHVNT